MCTCIPYYALILDCNYCSIRNKYGEVITRQYTPVSPRYQTDTFDIVIKVCLHQLILSHGSSHKKVCSGINGWQIDVT